VATSPSLSRLHARHWTLVALVAVAAWIGRIGEALPGGAVRLGVGTLHPLTVLWAVSGSLMISKTLRIPKL
jgi:CDP-diacylglycerol--serine O-phosphatidyltransferase